MSKVLFNLNKIIIYVSAKKEQQILIMHLKPQQQPRLFPYDRDAYIQVKSQQDLRQRIEQQRSKFQITKLMRFGHKKNTQNQVIALYARCKDCNVRLTYLKQNNSFILKKFKNTHDHSIILKNQMAKKKYFQMYNNLKQKDYRYGNSIRVNRRIVPQFTNISKAQKQNIYRFHKSYNKIMQKGIKVLHQQLKEKRFQVLMLPKEFDKDEVPKIIVIISPKMRKACIQYGHLVNLIVLKDVIVEEDRNQEISYLPYNLVLFTGRNNGNKLKIFGIGIYLNEAINLHIYFRHMIDFFLTVTKHKPVTLATSPLNQISQALKKLSKTEKWKGNHIIYAPHYLKQFEQKFEKKQILQQIKSTIYTDSKCLFKSRAAALNSYAVHPSQVKYIRQFLSQCQTICRSKIYPSHPSFIGISDRHRIQIALEAHLTQKVFKFQKNICDSVNSLLSLNKTIQNKTNQWQICQFHHQQIFKDPRLKEVRVTLHADVFQYFLKKLVSALQIHVTFLNNHCCKYENDLQSYLINENQQGVWVCDCNQILKIGLPCIHQLKVLDLIGGGNYLDYINKRWFSKNSQRFISDKQGIQLLDSQQCNEVAQVDPKNIKDTIRKSKRLQCRTQREQ